MAERVAVTGANGAVGCAILELGGPDLVACVRSDRAQSQLPTLPPGARVARISYGDAATLEQAFAECSAVVHLPGVLIERADSSYESANVDTTRIALEAAAKAGSTKFVLVSALGADPHAQNRYYRTKGEAEQLVRDSRLAWTILRAPLVLGARTEGTRALLRYARGGRALLLGGGRHRERPIDVGDLARGCLQAARRGVADGATLDLVGPEALLYRSLVERAAAVLSASIRITSLPVGLARAAAAGRTRLLGPGFSPDAVQVITAETQSDPPEVAARALGIQLTPLDETLRGLAQAAA